MRLLILAAAMLTVPAAAFCEDGEFDVFVRQLESEYGTKRMSIPLFGVANIFVKVVKPAGARNVQLAIFEDVDGGRHPSPERLDEMVQRLPTQNWKPFVRVRERDKERIQIYARPVKQDWELLMAVLERDEAIALRVRLRPEEVAKWVDNPVLMARSNGRKD